MFLPRLFALVGVVVYLCIQIDVRFLFVRAIFLWGGGGGGGTARVSMVGSDLTALG